jgi:hypothetical protein
MIAVSPRRGDEIESASMPSSLSSALYSSLKSYTSTRLFNLHAGSDSDVITGDLYEVDLKTGPEYEAISYVWGDAANLEPIVVNSHTILIRKNLWDCLRRLRHRKSDTSYWGRRTQY